jgi:hypothetical protein
MHFLELTNIKNVSSFSKKAFLLKISRKLSESEFLGFSHRIFWKAARLRVRKDLAQRSHLGALPEQLSAQGSHGMMNL